jgi:hypothetical protein
MSLPRMKIKALPRTLETIEMRISVQKDTDAR